MEDKKATVTTEVEKVPEAEKAHEAVDGADNPKAGKQSVVSVKKPVQRVPTKKPATKHDGFCVYLGPNKRGVIQSGSIYGGTREKTLRKLAPVIEKYPLVAHLIVTDRTLAEDRIKVKTAGNYLNVIYKRLVAEFSK